MTNQVDLWVTHRGSGETGHYWTLWKSKPYKDGNFWKCGIYNRDCICTAESRHPEQSGVSNIMYLLGITKNELTKIRVSAEGVHYEQDNEQQ